MVLNWGKIFLSRGHLAMSRGIFGCHTGERLLLASSGQRSGVLLNILQCTGQLPTTKNHPAQNIRSAQVEKPCSRAFVLLPWTPVVPIGVALFKEEGKNQGRPKVSTRQCRQGWWGSTHLILTAVKLEIPKPPLTDRSHQVWFPFSPKAGR